MNSIDSNGMAPTFARIAAAIDPSSSVSVSVQLRGALEYGIATGEIAPLARLPSVRQLAAKLGLSPVTVSTVYAALQERGQIEGRIGSGTFVTDRGRAAMAGAGQLAAFERKIAELIATGRDLGLSPQDVAYRVSLAPRTTSHPLRILVVGTFRDATAAYAEDLLPHLGDCDIAIPWIVGETAPLPRADLLFCPRTLTAEAQRNFPDTPMADMVLIPNETTRIALAALPPEAEVTAVSYFDDFLSVLKAGIGRFAPHVGHITALPRDAPDLAAKLEQCSILIHSTGAGYLRDRLRPDQTAIEYRHTPDIHTVRTELLPLIDRMRVRAGTKETTNEDK
ncbi:GntR family transcriptional regulator [Oceaniovalibus sp. ACAM 378]|uniref:GntR family transcriptional regulator n=1 Tax=Oceaniovalibus sp. ACAM 378 TaxID=2599923 RepID=UPI00210669F3|nr:GntR family transcriptional regulator [Oceaniovalibus sp. ACAM 378]